MNEPFLMGTTSSITLQSLGKIAQCVCRCENVVFFFFVGQALSLEHRAFEGRIVRTSIALPFSARFRRGFQFFSEGIALLDELHSSHFCR